MARATRLATVAGWLVLAASSARGQSITTYSAITFTPNPGGGVVVSWVAVPKAAAYQLTRFKEDDGCCNWSTSVAGTTLSILDGITAPGVYQYTVTAKYLRTTGPSVQGTYYLVALDPPPLTRRSVTVVTACTPAQQLGGPPPPTATARSYTATSANVAWDPVAGAVAYHLERALSGGSTWTDLGCLPSSQTDYKEKTRTDLPSTIYPGLRYVYKVTAFQSDGAAGWNSAHVTLGLMANPRSLTFTRTGNMVQLCWTFSVSSSTPAPTRFAIPSSYGTNFSVSGHGRCTTIYGAPDGTDIFQVGSMYDASPVMLETTPANRPSITVQVTP